MKARNLSQYQPIITVTINHHDDIAVDYVLRQFLFSRLQMHFLISDHIPLILAKTCELRAIDLGAINS